MKMLEEISAQLTIQKGERFLDLGCGKGLTSIFMAKEFEVQVFATDLWIPASENFQTFRSLGLEHLIIPIHADALEMPFADEYFDGVVSIDAYHYFGRNPQYMSLKLAPLVKKGGSIALAFPGLIEEFTDSLPAEMLQFWTNEEIETFHSSQWWEETFSLSPEIEINRIYEMSCFDECWADWIACDDEYAILDRQALEAGVGNYLNLIGAILTKI